MRPFTGNRRTKGLAMERAANELAYLRRVFGKDAESIHRGLAVASRGLELSDALGLVLHVRDLERTSKPIDGLELQIADAMREPPGRGAREETIHDLNAGARPFARLREDVRTSLGVVRAGWTVRIIDRRSDGRILVEALDLSGSVFPVPEALLDPTE
jgi:hypothetical protein